MEKALGREQISEARVARTPLRCCTLSHSFEQSVSSEVLGIHESIHLAHIINASYVTGTVLGT